MYSVYKIRIEHSSIIMSMFADTIERQMARTLTEKWKLGNNGGGSNKTVSAPVAVTATIDHAFELIDVDINEKPLLKDFQDLDIGLKIITTILDGFGIGPIQTCHSLEHLIYF